MVPRRLRWDVPLNDGLVDDESTKEWFIFFNTKGVERLRFLFKRKQTKIRSLDAQIQVLRDLTELQKEEPELVRLSGGLKSDVEKWEKEVKDKKRKKFLRDTGDYKEKKIFRWQVRLEEQEILSRESTATKIEGINKKMPKIDTQKGPHRESRSRSLRHRHLVANPSWNHAILDHITDWIMDRMVKTL